MRIHSIEKIKELKKMRKRGFSIPELVEKFSIPKTTVWHHVHNIRILPKYLPILKAKRGGSTKRKQKNLEEARKKAQTLLQGHNRDVVIAIAMLYWGEGSKKRCEFINSDEKIIESYLVVLREVFNVPENDIKPIMRIFSGMKREECLNHWSRVTKIPRYKFIVRFNDGGTKGRTRYGMCRIVVRKGSNILKLIHSLIDQVFKEIIRSGRN